MSRSIYCLFSVLILLILGACSEDENQDSPTETVRACTSYVDNGTHAYFQCIDYSQSSYSAAAVVAACAQQNSGVTSVNCSPTFTNTDDAEYPSTGSCAYTLQEEDLISRWYYVVEGDGLSETALCNAVSGTFTAD